MGLRGPGVTGLTPTSVLKIQTLGGRKAYGLILQDPAWNLCWLVGRQGLGKLD